jgi:tripartite ATP-independent transporter DctP family solute receptor
VYTIKFGLHNGIDDPKNDCEATWVLAFKAAVERNSGGAIKVDMYPNFQLGNANEMTNGVAANTIEMVVMNSNSFASLYPQSMILAVPGMFESEKEIDGVLESDWAKDFFLKMAQATNIYVVSARSNGMRCFTTSNRELTTVDTVRGVTFRVQENPLMVRMVESLGANAVPMAGSEMYTAMQNGTVDGQENPIGPILNDRTYEVQKYMVTDKHVASIVCYTMSYKFFQGLPAELQKVVLDAAGEAGIKASDATADINARGLSMLREKGLKIYEPTPSELAAWHAPILKACSEYIKTQIGPNALDGLSGAIAAHRKK